MSGVVWADDCKFFFSFFLIFFTNNDVDCHVDHTSTTPITTTTTRPRPRPCPSPRRDPMQQHKPHHRGGAGLEDEQREGVRWAAGGPQGLETRSRAPGTYFFFFIFYFFVLTTTRGPRYVSGPFIHFISFIFSHPAATYHPRTGARDASRAQTKLQASFGLKVSFFSFYLRVFSFYLRVFVVTYALGGNRGRSRRIGPIRRVRRRMGHFSSRFFFSFFF